MTIINFISTTGTKHIILSLLVFLVFADIKEIQAQVEIFDQFNEKISGLNYEKVYLHIDRSIYSISRELRRFIIG